MATVAAARAPEVLTVEFERESDGRWIAEIPELPGVLAYGRTQKEARRKAVALAFRVMADLLEDNAEPPRSVRFAVA